MRGVCQGFSIAPFLFVLSTQPHPSWLFLRRVIGRESSSVCRFGHVSNYYTKFLWMTGIFIKSTKENSRKATSLIAVYERISEAQLNLQKSLLIQLNVGPSPNWFPRASCRIAVWGEVFKYLRCPVGFDLGPNKILCFLMDNVRKKFRHWSNKLLTMVGHLVLIRHMIFSILVYYLMLFELNRDGY